MANLPLNEIMNREHDSSSNAKKVKIVEGNVTINASDIQIGAVEIKDRDSDNRAIVNDDGSLKVDIGVNPATQENQLTIISKLGLGDYYTNDIDDYSQTNIMYIGKEKDDGTWLILKLDMNTGTVIRGASETNNSTYTSYSSAWTNRLSLNYDYLKNVL